MKKLLLIFSIFTITTLPALAATVSGTVLDKNNKPLVGATISYNNAGTPDGTIADRNGNFELTNVPDDTKLEVSVIGYIKKTITPGENQKIHMEPDSTILEKVVVVVCTGDEANGIKSKIKINNKCYPSACVKPRWTLSGAGENAKCVEQECKIDNGTGEWTTDGNTWKCTVETCKNGYKHDKEKNKCSRDGEPDADEEDDTATKDTTPTDGEKEQTQPNEPRLSETDSLAKIEELRDNAEAMRAKEQSAANRLLGAAGIVTTGIGAMQTASAMAEQNADADAERTMRAYLATFHCDYGAGKSIQGGQSNIDLPGGNELIGLYSEYVNLANDLKVRKTALNIRPGIESEPILDAATSGLYDDVAIGETSGAYTSLARALMDPNGADAAAWAQQKSDTADRKKAGMITAGIGVAGSLAANLAINSGKNKQNKIDEILAEYDRQNTSKDGVNDKTIIKCIEVIMNTTHFITSQNKIKISCANHDHELTPQQALAISKNWDDKNLRPYSNTDSVVQEHEKDACETLKKLKKYIKAKDLCPELF